MTAHTISPTAVARVEATQDAMKSIEEPSHPVNGGIARNQGSTTGAHHIPREAITSHTPREASTQTTTFNSGTTLEKMTTMKRSTPLTFPSMMDPTRAPASLTPRV